MLFGQDDRTPVQVTLWPCFGDQITVNSLLDALLYGQGVLFEPSFEDSAPRDDAVESLIGRVAAIVKMRVEGVESLGPGLHYNVKMIVEAVLSGT